MTTHEQQNERVIVLCIMVEPAYRRSSRWSNRRGSLPRRRSVRPRRRRDPAATSRDAGARSRCAGDPSFACAATCISHPRGLSGRLPSAIAARPPAALLARRLRPCRSHRSGGSPRREPAVSALAAGSRGQTRRAPRHTSTGGALITSRTSIGMLSGSPPCRERLTLVRLCGRHARDCRRRRSNIRRGILSTPGTRHR